MKKIKEEIKTCLECKLSDCLPSSRKCKYNQVYGHNHSIKTLNSDKCGVPITSDYILLSKQETDNIKKVYNQMFTVTENSQVCN